MSSLDTAALRAAPRAGRAPICKRFLDEARAEVASAHRAGASGVETARAWSETVDRVVSALLVAAAPDEPPPVALVAVGGYGRRELCPGSDLDLWFVTARTPRGDDVRAVEGLAEEVLYPLWDLKLHVGHAVRTVDDCVALAREDLTAATALLDARHVCANAQLHRALVEASRKRIFDGSGPGGAEHAVVRALADDMRHRHDRFGDTVYLLEPDVKNGRGAYRDLLVSLWAAKAHFHVGDFADLLALGQATPRQVEALATAREFFLRVRTAAHLYAGDRRQDRLTFEVQEAIAPGLVEMSLPVDEPRDAAVAPAVEALLRQYYLHAKAVGREGARLVERCLDEPPRRPSVRKVDASFVLWNGALSTTGPEVFRERPAEMVRLFRVACELGVEIYGHTRDLVAEACARPETAAALAADKNAGRDFIAFLVDERDRREPSLLETMHDLGLLAALMPEFAPCTARVQHDIYHVFTVDQHSLYAVARLKALARRELDGELPVAAAAMREVMATGGEVPLYLGTLLHDVGKPLGKGHSEKGARLAEAIGSRLRLDGDVVGQVAFLVREHLTMSHLSQRRDLSDVEMIARFAARIGDEATLRALYLLTLADMSMVAPGNLTAWKEQLLRELYVRTLAHLRHGPDLAGVDRSARVDDKKRRVAALVGETEASLAPWFDGLPDRYFAQTEAEAVARHVALSRARRAGEVAAVAAHVPSAGAEGGHTELTILADDRPGVLASIAGVLVANRVDVLSAVIAGRRAGEAIDSFRVRDRYGRALTDERVASVRTDLGRVLAGATTAQALVAERRERRTLRARVVPHVPTEVKIDNEISNEYTVVDVFTQDRPGVLFAITGTLSELGLDIGLSKVATEADRVADVFYVRDGGRKLAGPAAAMVRERLVAALTALPVDEKGAAAR